MPQFEAEEDDIALLIHIVPAYLPIEKERIQKKEINKKNTT